MSSEHVYNLPCGTECEFIDAFVHEARSLSPYPPEKVERYHFGDPGDVKVTLRLSPHESMQSDYLLGLASGYSSAYKIGWDKEAAQYHNWYKRLKTMTREERVANKTAWARRCPPAVAELIVKLEDEAVVMEVRMGIKDAVIDVLSNSLDMARVRLRGILEDM